MTTPAAPLKRRRHLVTSALPYINGVKHLGNLVGSLLPADVFARYLRQVGDEVLFVSATDEHGTPAEIAAIHAGQSVEEFCARQHEIQRDIYQRFGLSFDYFGRSSAKANHDLTQAIFEDLDSHGYIEERVNQQLFSVGDGRFLPDRFVSGTCPICSYDQARGDQCENCTALLDPIDLLNPRSSISGDTNLELRETRHLYLLLSRLEPAIRQWVESNSHWPRVTAGIAQKWLLEGLHDRCITRDLHWGVPVPREGYEDKVFYVWFDAPIAYIAACREWSEMGDGRDWLSWWKSDDVVYSQFMAKDNVPFHTVFWPGVLMGTGAGWHLADNIKGFNWLNYYGGKFSTSQGRGVFTDRALDIAEPDVWRWVLLSMAPESSDSTFTWELYQAKVNTELAGKFGNFVNRSVSLARKVGDGNVPSEGLWRDAESILLAECSAVCAQISNFYRHHEYRKVTEAIRSLWDLGNSYINAHEPWKLVKTDPQTASMVLRTCLNLARLIAIVQLPITPTLSSKILTALPATDEVLDFDERVSLSDLAGGEAIGPLDPLVSRVSDEDLERLRSEYGS